MFTLVAGEDLCVQCRVEQTLPEPQNIQERSVNNFFLTHARRCTVSISCPRPPLALWLSPQSSSSSHGALPVFQRSCPVVFPPPNPICECACLSLPPPSLCVGLSPSPSLPLRASLSPALPSSHQWIAVPAESLRDGVVVVDEKRRPVKGSCPA